MGQRLDSHVNQCFSIALVESIMVPSMSNRKPWKEACSGDAENDIANYAEGTEGFAGLASKKPLGKYGRLEHREEQRRPLCLYMYVLGRA